MPWWGWIVLGTLLFCVELFAIDVQFYLVFIGAGALLVGILGLAGLELPVWGQWLLFALISLTAMVTFRRRLYDKLRGNIPDMKQGILGDFVTLGQALEPGASCRTEYRGTTWTAVNVGDVVIPSGSNAVIETMDGLTLNVKAG